MSDEQQSPKKRQSETAQEVSRESKPKTTRAESASRRHDLQERTVERKVKRRLDAFPDKIDIKDWFYQPTLHRLPDEVNNIGFVPRILDQKQDGACTGYALAAVINYLLRQASIERDVSPRMLYELARRYDEWPGEEYEGSSARGAMQAWVRHGACTSACWPSDLRGAQHMDTDRVADAALTPGGAYYRVDFRQIRHIHAAIYETGIVYATLMIHEGWERPGPTEVTLKPDANGVQTILPVIARSGLADRCHAIAIVGYTTQGFIVQNSWGRVWGADGFALLPYEDFMLHATDVWVAQLGVPVTADLWANGEADVSSGLFRAGEAISLHDIRPYVIDLGNNGELSDQGDYWTTQEDLSRLFRDVIPERARNWSKRRVMLYIHGGLNSEQGAAKRIVAYRDVCLRNEIYPLHIMWESDWLSTTRDIIENEFKAANERAGGSFMDHLRDARDMVLELTLARPGGLLWKQMKENAALASDGKKGGIRLLVAAVAVAARELPAGEKDGWELHVVAHSAGAILAAHAASLLSTLGIAWRSMQFMAPALRIDEFDELLTPQIGVARCPRPSMYMLSKIGELDDDVGPYGKSLLYLVSNALEPKRETPLLGMEKFIDADAQLLEALSAPIEGRPGIVISGAPGTPGSLSRSDTHSGFDNDPDTMNSILVRILGHDPDPAFTFRDLRF